MLPVIVLCSGEKGRSQEADARNAVFMPGKFDLKDAASAKGTFQDPPTLLLIKLFASIRMPNLCILYSRMYFHKGICSFSKPYFLTKKRKKEIIKKKKVSEKNLLQIRHHLQV